MGSRVWGKERSRRIGIWLRLRKWGKIRLLRPRGEIMTGTGFSATMINDGASIGKQALKSGF